jgi:hypothetical protein
LLQKALGWGDVGDGKTNPTIFKWLGIDKQKLDSFRGALSRSGKQSVDSFLEHRPEFLDVGKAVTPLKEQIFFAHRLVLQIQSAIMSQTHIGSICAAIIFGIMQAGMFCAS